MKMRFSLSVLGLLLLVVGNSTIAMSLGSGRPGPIDHGPGDIVNNPGWELASYQMYPWWLSEQFDDVTISNVGGLDTTSQIRIEVIPFYFSNVTVLAGEPLDLREIDLGSLQALKKQSRLTPGHKVLCRRHIEAPFELCDFLIAWDTEPLESSEPNHARFIGVNFGVHGFGLLDEATINNLKLSKTPVGRPQRDGIDG